jgi:hypothetical protein
MTKPSTRGILIRRETIERLSKDAGSKKLAAMTLVKPIGDGSFRLEIFETSSGEDRRIFRSELKGDVEITERYIS